MCCCLTFPYSQTRFVRPAFDKLPPPSRQQPIPRHPIFDFDIPPRPNSDYVAAFSEAVHLSFPTRPDPICIQTTNQFDVLVILCISQFPAFHPRRTRVSGGVQYDVSPEDRSLIGMGLMRSFEIAVSATKEKGQWLISIYILEGYLRIERKLAIDTAASVEITLHNQA